MANLVENKHHGRCHGCSYEDKRIVFPLDVRMEVGKLRHPTNPWQTLRSLAGPKRGPPGLAALGTIWCLGFDASVDLRSTSAAHHIHYITAK